MRVHNTSRTHIRLGRPSSYDRVFYDLTLLEYHAKSDLVDEYGLTESELEFLGWRIPFSRRVTNSSLNEFNLRWLLRNHFFDEMRSSGTYKSHIDFFSVEEMWTVPITINFEPTSVFPEPVTPFSMTQTLAEHEKGYFLEGRALNAENVVIGTIRESSTYGSGEFYEIEVHEWVVGDGDQLIQVKGTREYDGCFLTYPSIRAIRDEDIGKKKTLFLASQSDDNVTYKFVRSYPSDLNDPLTKEGRKKVLTIMDQGSDLGDERGVNEGAMIAVGIGIMCFWFIFRRRRW